MSFRKLALGLVMVGVLGWGGTAMAAADPALNTDVKVNITCRISTILLGWTIDGTTDNTPAVDGLDDAGITLTWDLADVDLDTAYASTVGGAGIPKQMVLKNWGSAAIDVAVGVAVAGNKWTLITWAEAGADNSFRMRYDATFDSNCTTAPAADLKAVDGGRLIDSMGMGDANVKGLTLEVKTPISISGTGADAQTITVTLTGGPEA